MLVVHVGCCRGGVVLRGVGVVARAEVVGVGRPYCGATALGGGVVGVVVRGVGVVSGGAVGAHWLLLGVVSARGGDVFGCRGGDGAGGGWG